MRVLDGIVSRAETRAQMAALAPTLRPPAPLFARPGADAPVADGSGPATGAGAPVNPEAGAVEPGRLACTEALCGAPGGCAGIGNE